MKNYLLWDLDGTLTDPKIGILTCIQYALQKFGLTAPPFESLIWCIGPPLYESFPRLAPGTTKDEVDLLVSFYRERFATLGLYENKVYPEIQPMLAELSKTKKQFLATSKPHLFANRILNHFELADYFQRIHGSELSGERSDKGELIKYILEKENIPANETYMIGDRKHDIIGAKKNNMTSIGVAWGYGGKDELQEAGADIIVESPIELKRFLLETT